MAGSKALLPVRAPRQVCHQPQQPRTPRCVCLLSLFAHTDLKHLPRFLCKLLHSDEVAAAVIKTQLITYPLNCDDRILSIW